MDDAGVIAGIGAELSVGTHTADAGEHRDLQGR
jgi:hypothetical protein